ncbi:hypothetical protein DRQ20_02900, partial [bacterium]
MERLKIILCLSFLLISACMPKKEILIKTVPSEADIYVNGKYIGKSPQMYTFSFYEAKKEYTVVAKKYGYVPAEKIITRDFPLDELKITLEKEKKKKLGYIVPIIEEEEMKMRFSLVYEYGFYETIERSPNALHVRRIVSVDDVNEIIGKFDVKKNILVYTRIISQRPINTDEYIRNVELLSDLVKALDKIVLEEDDKEVYLLLEKLEKEKKEYIELLGFYLYRNLKKTLELLEKNIKEKKDVAKTENLKILEELSHDVMGIYKKKTLLSLEDLSAEIW